LIWLLLSVFLAYGCAFVEIAFILWNTREELEIPDRNNKEKKCLSRAEETSSLLKMLYQKNGPCSFA
jgi:hypothetical protein